MLVTIIVIQYGIIIVIKDMLVYFKVTFGKKSADHCCGFGCVRSRQGWAVGVFLLADEGG